MKKNFWQELRNKKQPFFALAPMADVTDFAFREMIAKYSRHNEEQGGPDVFWTEFVSCDGLCSEGEEKLLHILEFSKKQKPIIAQIFSSNTENVKYAVKKISKMGFDGIDINMGCPDKSIEKQGAGASLMKTPDLAVEVIEATKQEAGNLPVSVKTRLGYNKNEVDTWIPKLLNTKIDALTIHARTRKEMSKVPARWEEMKKIVQMAKSTDTIIIGNGDVASLEQGVELAKQTGVDGIMIGRGVFGNPWFFNSRKNYKNISIQEKLKVLIEHTKLFEKRLSKDKNFAVMKKHFKAYVNNFDGAKELRVKLMKANNAEDVRSCLKSHRKGEK